MSTVEEPPKRPAKNDWEESVNRETARRMIVNGNWNICGKEAELQVATPEIARMISSEINKQVLGHVPQISTDNVDIITVRTKKNILQEAQRALASKIER